MKSSEERSAQWSATQFFVAITFPEILMRTNWTSNSSGSSSLHGHLSLGFWRNSKSFSQWKRLSPSRVAHNLSLSLTHTHTHSLNLSHSRCTSYLSNNQPRTRVPTLSWTNFRSYFLIVCCIFSSSVSTLCC